MEFYFEVLFVVGALLSERLVELDVRAGEGGGCVETGAQGSVQLRHVECGLLVFVAVVLGRFEDIGHVACHVSSIHRVLVLQLLET